MQDHISKHFKWRLHKTTQEIQSGSVWRLCFTLCLMRNDSDLSLAQRHFDLQLHTKAFYLDNSRPHLLKTCQTPDKQHDAL